MHRIERLELSKIFDGRPVGRAERLAELMLARSARRLRMERLAADGAGDDTAEGTNGASPRICRFQAEQAEPGGARARRADLLTTLPHFYERAGCDSRRMAFCVDGTIGVGRGEGEETWDLVEERGELCLEIASKEGPTCRLRRCADGVWMGRRLDAEGMPVSLTPLPPPEYGGEEHLETFLPACGIRPELVRTLSRLRQEAPDGAVIVEIGTIRSADPAAREADGWSTRCLGWYAAAFGARFHAVDLSADSLHACRTAVAGFLPAISFHRAEGAEFLRGFKRRIDLLHLDAWEGDAYRRGTQYLDAYCSMAERPRLILLRAPEGRSAYELMRLELTRQALLDGYEVALQTSSHLLLAYGQGAAGADTGAVTAPETRPEQQTVYAPTARPGCSGRATRPHPMRVYSRDLGSFRALDGANVLIYWPYGLRDWVSLSYVLPLMRRSNRYWVLGAEDDIASVFEGSDYARPLYFGGASPLCDPGGALGCNDLGLTLDGLDGGLQMLRLPTALAERCELLGIDALLWSSRPATFGACAPPFHTMCRSLLPALADPDLLAAADLEAPLPSGIRFAVDSWLAQWVEGRLRSLGGFGARRLCVIARKGCSMAEQDEERTIPEDPPGAEKQEARETKECRDFMRLLLRKDPNWLFVTVAEAPGHEDTTLCAEALHAYSYTQMFGPLGGVLPYNLVLKALFGRADLVVGDPIGPYHLAMAKPGLPTVGLWTEDLPGWYDEPRARSRHLISRTVRDRGLHERPGGFVSHGRLAFPTRWLETPVIPGEAVLAAVEELLYS